MRSETEPSSGPETGLSVFCATLMEAAWLSCLVVTPLLFDVHSNSVFEVDKAAVVRSLALGTVMAGLVRMSERRIAEPGRRARAGSPSPALRRLRSWMVGHPWVIVALVYLCVHALATLVSVAPRLSLWGSFARAQGLYTTAAYLAIFIAVLAACRTRPQIERIIQACLLTSLPVSLYGIVQRFGSDPIPWKGDVSVRVGSTLGNPIFLGAFLIMVVPLTIYRHVEAGKRVTEGQTAFVKSMFIGGGVLNVLLQVIAWSRGPVSGSLAALVTLGLWSIQGRVLDQPLRWFVRIGACGVLLSAQLAAIVLSGSRGPSLALLVGLSVFAMLWASTRGKGKWLGATLALGAGLVVALVWLNLSGSPPLDRDHRGSLSRFAHLLEGTGRVRLLIWEGVMELLPEDPARLLLGHGPESGQLVMSPHVPPGLGRLERALPDRSHNETLDAVVTTGLLGLAAYLLLFTGTLGRGLRWAGAAATPNQRRFGAAMCLAGAAGAVLLARLLDGSWRLSGVAVPAGMLVGFCLSLGSHVVWRRASRRAARPRWSDRRTLAVLVFSALVAHFVEIQVGIAITATRLYFWVFLALMVGVLARLRRPATGRAEGWGGDRVPASHLAAGLMVTVSTATLVSDFVAAGEAASITVLWIAGVTWVLGGILLFAETIGESTGPGLRRTLIVYGGLPLLGVSLIVVLHLVSSRLVSDPSLTPVPVYAVLFLLLGTLAISLREGPRVPGLAGSRQGAVVALGLGILTIAMILGIGLDVVRADISLKQAQLFASRPGGMDRAVSWARRAVAIQPAQDHAHNLLGQLQQRQAEGSADSDQRRKLFDQAEESFLTAHELSPLLAENALNLARLYRGWGEHTRDEEARRSLYGRALTYYRKALARYPTSVRTWNELATTYGLMGEPDEAEAAFARSLALDDTFAGTYVDRGRLDLARGNPGPALEAFRRAIAQDGRSVEAFRGRALAYARLGRPAEAARAYQDLLALRPADLDAHLQLARVYSRLGRPDLASAHARAALELVPPSRRPAIQRLVKELLAGEPPVSNQRGRR